jgi:hypothetical protein
MHSCQNLMTESAYNSSFTESSVFSYAAEIVMNSALSSSSPIFLLQLALTIQLYVIPTE